MRQPVLTHKYVAPALPPGPLTRPRLNARFHELFAQMPVVVVSSAVGTGKTVQAQLFAQDLGWPVAWLTLDVWDVSPARFLSGLSMALERYSSGGTDAAQSALRSGAAVQEAAATLATTLFDGQLLLVIDDGEHLRLDDTLLGALTTFLEYAPGSLRTLIVTREPLGGPVGRRILEGEYGLVADADLNLDLDEITSMLRTRGLDPSDAASVHESTGGWVAGLVFGSRIDHRTGERYEEFAGYLRDRILGPLSPDERSFLLKTSIADVVTPALATALVGPHGPRLFGSIAHRHLPAVSANDQALTYHSVLRSFLRAELRMSLDREADLFRQGAEHFRSVRDFHRATEWFLEAGELELAGETAESELPELYQRSDWLTIERWLDRLGEQIVRQRPSLLAARIRSMFGLRQFDEVVALIRHTDQRGELRRATDADRGLLAIVGWALQADASEAKRYLDKYDGDYRVAAVRYMLDVTTGVDPVVPPLFAGDDDVIRPVSWGLLWQGRLSELIRLAPATEDLPVMNPNLILAFLWRGDVDVARRMWARVPGDIKTRAQSRFIEACILLAEGRPTDALDAVQAAIADSRRTGFSFDSLYEVFAALILLSLGSTSDAAAMLERKIVDLSESGKVAIVELAQTALGLAFVQLGRVEEARLVLEECVRTMARAQRRLFFPVAAAYLAEVYAQLDEDELAHEAAGRALEVASLMGSYFWLIEALRAVPAVLDREVERDPSDTRWRRLLFAPSAQVERTRSTSRPSIVVEVRTFGPERDLIVNGEPAGIGRLKVIELAACLSIQAGGVDRFELQRRLFPDVDQRRGGNHFRQVAHKLREATGLILARSGSLVTWPDYAHVEATDVTLEQLIVAAAAVTGRDRFDRLREGLAGAVGEYLEGSDLPWVEERRNHLSVVMEEALLELAQLGLDLGELNEARSAAERVVQLNPFCDSAYLVLMHVERALGTPASCQAVFRRAVDAMAQLGLQPDPRMVELMRVMA